MRFHELIGETKLNGLTIIPLDQFLQHGYPKDNVEAEDMDESLDESLLEAEFGFGAGKRVAGNDEMQNYLGRIRNKLKTKLDPYTMPYIHDKKIQIKDQDGETYDLEALKANIMKRPSGLLKKNEKMKHSNGTADQYYNVGLPALKGLAVNEETGEFVIVDTCPGAGACKTFCYAMKGSYIQYPDVFMKQTQTLNYLLNDPEGFSAQLTEELSKAIEYWDKFSAKSKLGKTEDGPVDVKVAIRFHDSGDFFSPEYMRMAFAVARQFPDNLFYAYTKVASVANSSEKPDNFILNFSAGALSTQSKLVNITGADARKHSQVVPKDMFDDLVLKSGGKLVKSESGATQIKDAASWDALKERIAKHFAISKESIISYDQFMEKKMAGTLGDKPRWNVTVFPGEGDVSATDSSVIGTYLMFH
jgi:hypothetical protein